MRYSQSDENKKMTMTKKEEDNVCMAPPVPRLHPRDPSLNLLGGSCCQRIFQAVHEYFANLHSFR